MQGTNTWSFAPYRPLMFDVGDIYVCRLCPGTCRVSLDWLPLDGADVCTVQWKKRGTDDAWSSADASDCTYTIADLEDDVDYEVRVTCGDRSSRVRLARTGDVPGDVVVNYLHPEDEAYAFSGRSLCSPSLVRLDDGTLLASMDVFAGGEPQDLTLIYRSTDNGATWHYSCELFPCFWGKMFTHRGALYMLSCSTEYGDLLIGRSDDGGRTFGSPTVLLRGTNGFKHKGVHKNPQPVVSYGGRLWCTLEWGSWASGSHAAMAMSVDEDADLLDATNWHFTPPVPYDPNWKGTAVGPSRGCIEGCMVVDGSGRLLNVMRYQMDGCTPSFGRAVVMGVKSPDEPLEFDRVIEFPGNHSKFMIKRSDIDGRYYSIVSYLDESHPVGRNLISLVASDDLEHWTKVRDIFDYRHMSANDVGFQYVDFIFDGEDMRCLCRTSYRGARNYHDANYSVFFTICGYAK